MIPVIKSNGIEERKFIKSLKLRTDKIDKDVTDKVSKIIENIKLNGDKALLEYTRKFDNIELKTIEVTKDKIKNSLNLCEPEYINSLELAKSNIEEFHLKQKHQGFIDAKSDGIILGQRVRGLNKVGIYVPGGTASYPSSVLMNAIPAKIAGVKEVIMVTPPTKGGEDYNNILAAAAICEVDRVFTIGGAQSIAALAFGTDSVPRVDKIVGPGNIFVATAKKLLYGKVDIDMIAGPSEILVVADDTANPKFLAADLMSQAEHDTLSSSILITTSERIANETKAELEFQVDSLSRKDIIKESLSNFSAIIICDNLETAIGYANELAPEHLEICVKNPFEYIGKIDNAGSIFLGNYSPEPLGDYFAGPNHVLPTSGTARFFSPLSVDSFVKKSSFIYYPKEAFIRDSKDVIRLAETEGLTAHANSVKVRL